MFRSLDVLVYNYEGVDTMKTQFILDTIDETLRYFFDIYRRNYNNKNYGICVFDAAKNRDIYTCIHAHFEDIYDTIRKNISDKNKRFIVNDTIEEIDVYFARHVVKTKDIDKTKFEFTFDFVDHQFDISRYYLNATITSFKDEFMKYPNNIIWIANNLNCDLDSIFHELATTKNLDAWKYQFHILRKALYELTEKIRDSGVLENVIDNFLTMLLNDYAENYDLDIEEFDLSPLKYLQSEINILMNFK